MRLADLWQHNAFRLALGVTLFILATLILASGIGYGLLQTRLDAQQDARVTEIFAAIEQTSLEGDEVDLTEAVTARIKASPDRTTVYLLRSPTGRILAANIDDVALAPGWSTLMAALVGVPTDESYRLFSGPAGGYGLTVGLTNADLDDLLRIAQIEARARRAKFAALDLGALVADVAEVYVEVAEVAGQTLVCDGTGPAWVLGDRELLTQCFANLIENAIRHCTTGTAITCAVTLQRDRVTARVTDSGPGIPAGEHALVLRSLYRRQKSRTTEGTGLGLSLVKAVADLHGAELVLSEATPGLRVDMRFSRIGGALSQR